MVSVSVHCLGWALVWWMGKPTQESQLAAYLISLFGGCFFIGASAGLPIGYFVAGRRTAAEYAFLGGCVGVGIAMLLPKNLVF